jgi:hypothetical protein
MAAAKDQRGIWEIVQCADLAVRAASVLRQLQAGREPNDLEILTEARAFLDRAQNGGTFITEGIAQMSGQTLRPFNWATDTYLQAMTAPIESQPDYKQVNAYIERIGNTLRDINTPGRLAVDPQHLSEATQFFETLGDIVGGRADFILSTENIHTIIP